MNLQSMFNSIDNVIKNNELHAFYQPVFDVKTRKIVGCEALARIIKRDGKVLSPMTFLPFIEDSIDALALDWHIIEEVCAFLANRKRRGLSIVPISINLSKMHNHEKDFVEKLCLVVDKYKIPHEYINLELTEGTLEYFSESAHDVMSALREKGFKLFVDDFGVGLFSLNFIRNVDIDALKVDRTVISGEISSQKDHIIVETILFLGEKLGVDVILEGVETEEQLKHLQDMGCSKAQGFYLSKPIDPVSFDNLLGK